MDLSSLRKALLDSDVYPDRPLTVGFIETHISLLFFTGKTVYKLKKPVDFGFLDFTTLERRQFFCEQEVTLNRRMATDLYLGVTRITEKGKGVSLDGEGRILEYAVKMRQISEDRLLDKLLRRNELTPAMIEAVSAKLVDFYARAETNDRIKAFAKPSRVKQDTDENFDQTEKYISLTLSRDMYRDIQTRTNDFVARREDLFYHRIASDKVRDCHGDLRLEHIFYGDTISIFDCIEFNERFRYTDVAADIAFLAMDLDYQGRSDLSDHLIQIYIEQSGDQDLRPILDFYKCYRAYVRGKVESFRLDDRNIPEEEKERAKKRAQRYFQLSHQYALRI